MVVAGKGGVGRSTITALLAADAAAGDQRVLAIDAVDDGGLEAALAVRPDNGQKRVEVLRLSTEAALQQYLDIYLRLPVSPTRLRPLARIFDYVATAAPGVREILALGKMAWEAIEGPWDLVIVDGPATGHVVELLAAADNLGQLIGFGPLAQQTGWISELVADPERSEVVVVSTPEELAVTETIELITRLGSETQATVSELILNRLPPLPESSAESARLVAAGGPLGAAVQDALDRSAACIEQQRRLGATQLPITVVAEGQSIA